MFFLEEKNNNQIITYHSLETFDQSIVGARYFEIERLVERHWRLEQVQVRRVVHCCGIRSGTSRKSIIFRF